MKKPVENCDKKFCDFETFKSFKNGWGYLPSWGPSPLLDGNETSEITYKSRQRARSATIDRFPFDHRSQAALSPVSTWMGDRLNAVRVHGRRWAPVGYNLGSGKAEGGGSTPAKNGVAASVWNLQGLPLKID